MTEPLNNNTVLGTVSGFSYCSNPINCCCFLLQEIIPTQGFEPVSLEFPALEDRLFTTRAWQGLP